MLLEHKVEKLNEIEIFSQLNTSDLAALAEVMQEEKFPADTEIVHENEVIDKIYLIIAGNAEVTKQQKRKQVHLAFLTAGDSIGLSTTGFYSQTSLRTATVTTLESVTTLSISIEQLNQFLQQQPAVNTGMLNASDLMLKAKLIRNASSFSGLSSQEIHELAKLVETVTVKAGAVIFSQGEVGDQCYLIRSGEVSVLLKTEQDEHVIATLTTPMIFGETSLLTDSPRSATLKAETDCELLTISKAQFESFYSYNVRVASQMRALLIERSRPKRNTLVQTFTQQTSDGEMITILKNPLEGRYYRLSRVGLYIWNCLDGKTTLQEIVMGVFENFFIFSLEMVQNLVANLIESDFAQLDEQVKIKINHKK